ncbi:MAG: ZIP family metal transporter, partial [Mangrovibacterium sp.]
MFIWFYELQPVTQALVATIFTWFVTALGAGMVFFFKTIHRRVLDGMLGFAAGVMIAASIRSLHNPAIDMVEAAGGIAWLPPLIGFLAGGAFLWVVDQV